MAGRGRAPKPSATRRNTAPPIRGEWRSSPGVGWQHGRLPPPPKDVLPVTERAWRGWLGAWFAAFWSPEDLPQLETLALLFDAVQRGKLQRSAELRLWMDSLGISFKGQQDRRWAPPQQEEKPKRPAAPARPHQYEHLKVVD